MVPPCISGAAPLPLHTSPACTNALLAKSQSHCKKKKVYFGGCTNLFSNSVCQVLPAGLSRMLTAPVVPVCSVQVLVKEVGVG